MIWMTECGSKVDTEELWHEKKAWTEYGKKEKILYAESSKKVAKLGQVRG